MADIKELDTKMNEMVANGEILEAFEEFTSDDVVMKDVLQGEGWEGKQACREHELEFLNFVEEVHEVALHEAAVEGDVSFSEWTFHLTFKNGDVMDRRQVERRKWKNGKVVEVYFF